jgi:hypothetical protein
MSLRDVGGRALLQRVGGIWWARIGGWFGSGATPREAMRAAVGRGLN